MYEFKIAGSPNVSEKEHCSPKDVSDACSPPIVANHQNLCFYVLIITLCSVPLGLDIGSTGHLMGMSTFIERHSISTQTASPVIFIFHVGCMCGCCMVLFGRIPQRVGYLNSLRIGFSLYQLGGFVLALSLVTPPSFIYLFIARFLFGVSCGMLSVVAPVLIAQMCIFTSHKHDFLYACHLTTGVAMVVTSCLFLVNDSRVEYLFYAIQMFLPPLAVGLSFTLPSAVYTENTRILKNTLAKLVKNSSDIQVYEKAVEILNNAKGDIQGVSSSNANNAGLVLCCTLMALQQLTGVSFFFYFGKLLFESILNAEIARRYSTLFLCFCSLAGTTVSYPLMRYCSIYKGLLCGSILNTMLLVCFTGLGIAFSAGQDANLMAGYSMLVIACMFQFVFACSWGPYVGIICVDLSNASSKIMSVSVLVGWAINILVMATMPALTNIAGYGSISVFSVFSALSVAFVWTLEKRTEA